MKPYSRADELIPPFGLGYLATAIRKNHNVEILDGIKEKLTFGKLEKILRREKTGYYRHSGFYFSYYLVRQYLDLIKRVLPEAKIILGGPHPSSSP